MARRFGWKSVLWTAWLGTPIHELSHALMCVVFRHRIDEMALFEPDFESGRLGYVRHSYVKGNLFQEIGNAFIGIAPLIGGTIVLLIALRVFVPGALTESMNSIGNEASLVQQVLGMTSTLLSQVFSNGLTNWRTWLFLYVVLCVGCHMAPSMSDYQGGKKGAFILAAIFCAGGMFVGLFVPADTQIATLAAPVLAPMLAIYAMVALLVFVATVVIFVLTAVWDLLPFTGT